MTDRVTHINRELQAASDAVQDELDLSEKRYLESRLHEMGAKEAQLKALAEEVDAFKARLKDYHERHPEDVVADLEHGVVAEFYPRSLPALTDMSRAAEAPDAGRHFLELARLDLLTPRLSDLRKRAGRSAAVDFLLPYVMPPGQTTSVRIRKDA